MFVAERTEERIDGAWRRVAYETPGDITDLPEEEPGWFGRAWSQIFGD
jgi:hypothetical protein